MATLGRPESAKVEKYLGGVDYPASKDQLVENARSHGAGQDIIEALASMPDGEYGGPNEVSRAVAKE
jgi:hypothetical protein